MRLCSLLLVFWGTTCVAANNNLIDYQQTILPSMPGTASGSDDFGTALDFTENTLVFKSLNGATLVFEKVANEWVESGPLVPNGADYLTFADRVTMNDDYIFIASHDEGGSIYVFSKVGGEWINTQKIEPNEDFEFNVFGYSIDADTNSLLVGSSKYISSVTTTSGLFIYELTNGLWQESVELPRTDIGQLDIFAFEVDMFRERVLAVGDRINDAVYVFMFNTISQQWEQHIRYTDPAGSNNGFGSSVAINQLRMLVGAPEDATWDKGAVHAYEFRMGAFHYDGVIRPVGLANYDKFGSAVSLYGSQAVITQKNFALNRDDGFYYYEFSHNEGWVNQQFVKFPENPSWKTDFGNVAKIDDGIILTSAPVYSRGLWFDVNQSQVTFQSEFNVLRSASGLNLGHTFSVDNGRVIAEDWLINQDDNVSEVLHEFDSEDAQPQSAVVVDWPRPGWFQPLITLKQDNWLAVGDEYFHWNDGNENQDGVVKIFEYENNQWQETATIKPTMYDETVSLFGSSVIRNEDSLFVGSPADIVGQTNEDGAVHIFKLQNGEWAQQQRLLANDINNGNNFGSQLKLYNGELFVGAYSHYGKEAVYVFGYENGMWVQKQKLIPAESSARKSFGEDILVKNNKMFISAYRDDHGANLSFSGSVTQWNKVNGVWQEGTKITSPNMMAGEFFGSSIAASEDYLFVGARGNSGVLYQYKFNENNEISYVADVSYEDIRIGNQFGAKVIVEGDKLYIGDPSAGYAGASSGAIHIYDIKSDLIFTNSFD